jgi:hypothetical protein
LGEDPEKIQQAKKIGCLFEPKGTQNMNEHPLRQILHPPSVAMVGASKDIFKMGTIQLLKLLGGRKFLASPIFQVYDR